LTLYQGHISPLQGFKCEPLAYLLGFIKALNFSLKPFCTLSVALSESTEFESRCLY